MDGKGFNIIPNFFNSIVKVLNLINAIEAPQIFDLLYFTLVKSKILFEEQLQTKSVFQFA